MRGAGRGTVDDPFFSSAPRALNWWRWQRREQSKAEHRDRVRQQQGSADPKGGSHKAGGGKSGKSTPGGGLSAADRWGAAGEWQESSSGWPPSASRRPEGDAAEAAYDFHEGWLSPWLRTSSEVEVVMEEEGLWGSKYPAVSAACVRRECDVSAA